MTFSDRHVLQSPQQNLVKKKFDIKKKKLHKIMGDLSPTTERFTTLAKKWLQQDC